MNTIKVFGQIDGQHRLSAQVPPTVAPGQVEVLVLVPDASEDEAGRAWQAGFASEWNEELGDTREDIYSLDDGEPVRPRAPNGQDDVEILAVHDDLMDDC